MKVIEKKITSQYFPSTRYQGSKRKILDWIEEQLDGLDYQTVLDAFGGTGAVSYLFKTKGKSVTYNDSLKFNTTIGKALIENSSVKLSSSEIDLLLNLDEIELENSFIADNFNNIYFTDEENVWLDKFMYNLQSVFKGDPQSSVKIDLALFGLFQACLTKRPYNLFHRKNLYMRLNDVKRNFGNKVTWERTFEDQVRKFIEEANRCVFDNSERCVALNQDALSISGEYDLVYLDPPYVDINGDHDTIDYLYCYHFLEGLMDYNQWGDMIDFTSKNLRYKKELHSTAFKKRNVLDSFNKLFDIYQKSTIVISYKKNGIPSIEEILELLSKYKTSIQVKSMHYKYALNKQNGNARENREVLIIAQ